MSLFSKCQIILKVLGLLRVLNFWEDSPGRNSWFFLEFLDPFQDIRFFRKVLDYLSCFWDSTWFSKYLIIINYGFIPFLRELQLPSSVYIRGAGGKWLWMTSFDRSYLLNQSFSHLCPQTQHIRLITIFGRNIAFTSSIFQNPSTKPKTWRMPNMKPNCENIPMQETA